MYLPYYLAMNVTDRNDCSEREYTGYQRSTDPALGEASSEPGLKYREALKVSHRIKVQFQWRTARRKTLG